MKFTQLFQTSLVSLVLFEWLLDEANYTTASSPPFDSLFSYESTPVVSFCLGYMSFQFNFRAAIFTVFFFRLWDSMRLTIVRARKGKQKPSSTIVQPFLHVRSLQIQHMLSVVGCQTVQHLLMIIFTRPGWIWQLKDDTISSMTFVRSTSKKKVITSNKGYIDMLRLL